MDVNTRDATTFVGFALTWLGMIFGVGKAYGKLATRVEKNEEDIQELKSTHIFDVKEIEKMFVTRDGEPRLMSYKAHDQISANCKKLQEERYRLLEASLERIEEKLDNLATSGKRLRL